MSSSIDELGTLTSSSFLVLSNPTVIIPPSCLAIQSILCHSSKPPPPFPPSSPSTDNPPLPLHNNKNFMFARLVSVAYYVC